MIKFRKQKQKFYYDRHSHELPALHDGDTVRMRLPGENEWSLGHVIGEEGPRSFRVDVNGKHYRCNHRWLRVTPEEVEPTVTVQDLTEPGSEPEGTISADVSLPTMPASVEVPESSTGSRSVRECRPPAWLKDYECEH